MLAFHVSMLHASAMLTWAQAHRSSTEYITFRNLHSCQRNLGLSLIWYHILQSKVRQQHRLGKGVLVRGVDDQGLRK